MRVVHCKKEPFDVYIGRPSKWGNEFSHVVGSKAKYAALDRGEAIEMYETALRNNDKLLADLPEIAGKDLGCWCKPLPCHGDVLVKLCKERGLIT